MIGQKFGHLTVLEVDLNYKKQKNILAGELYYKCQCDCPSKTLLTVSSYKLRTEQSKSCGCAKGDYISIAKRKDLTNQVFGFLQALYPINWEGKGRTVWRCRCLRDNVECDIDAHSLQSGQTISCGCIVSYGESKCKLILQEKNICFETQKTFKDLTNPDTGYKLKYDLFLPEYNTIIEYDGRQHFAYTNQSWNTEEHFYKCRFRDHLKNQYCFDSGILLIRIPYYHLERLTIEDLLPETSQFLLTPENEEQYYDTNETINSTIK